MPNNPMSLEALKQSLMSGMTAKGSMNELDLQREQANALRDTPLAQGGRRSGYVSPFMIAANTAQRLSGEREGRRIGQERQGLSQAVAQAATDDKMYGHQTQAAATQQAQDNWQTTQDTGVEQFGLRQAAGERRAAEVGGRHEDTMMARAFDTQQGMDEFATTQKRLTGNDAFDRYVSERDYLNTLEQQAITQGNIEEARRIAAYKTQRGMDEFDATLGFKKDQAVKQGEQFDTTHGLKEQGLELATAKAITQGEQFDTTQAFNAEQADIKQVNIGADQQRRTEQDLLKQVNIGADQEFRNREFDQGASEFDQTLAARAYDSQLRADQFADTRAYREAKDARDQGNKDREYELKLQKATGIDPEKLKGMTGEHKKSLVGNQEAINDINSINSLVGEFTPEETAMMQSAKKQLMSLAVEAIAPAEFQQWARKNISKYPPRIQKYFELVNQFSGKIRHEVYGSALTGTEVNFSNMWLPGNTGLSLEQHQSRLDNLAKRAQGSQKAIGKAYEHDFMNILPEYKGVEAPLPATDDKGGELMTDKNGKRAYVYPDGTFKEVQ